MKTKTEILLELWIESRTRFSNQLTNLTAEDLRKKLPPSQNSLGFLIRHIGEVELLFAKNVFGSRDIKVSAETVKAQRDTGEWTNLEELKEYVLASFDALRAIVARQTDEDWETTITTKEGQKQKPKPSAE